MLPGFEFFTKNWFIKKNHEVKLVKKVNLRQPHYGIFVRL